MKTTFMIALLTVFLLQNTYSQKKYASTETKEIIEINKQIRDIITIDKEMELKNEFINKFKEKYNINQDPSDDYLDEEDDDDAEEKTIRMVETESILGWSHEKPDDIRMSESSSGDWNPDSIDPGSFVNTAMNNQK